MSFLEARMRAMVALEWFKWEVRTALPGWLKRWIWGPPLVEVNPYLRDPEFREYMVQDAVRTHLHLRDETVVTFTHSVGCVFADLELECPLERCNYHRK